MAFDSLSGAMRSEREYGLMPYLSYSLVGFHPLFSERGGPKIERPKADWDVSNCKLVLCTLILFTLP